MSDGPAQKKQKQEPKTLKVFGICNPLLDISANVQQDMLDKYDLKRGNAILAEAKHLPLYAELDKDFHLEYIAGGAGQNSIRVCQWMLKDHPHSTHYVGCVGKDKNAEKLKEIATSDGVEVHYMEVDVPTGTCACLITDKERSLVANLSAAEKYKKTHFDSEPIQKVLNDCSIFYATAFFITHSFDSLMALGKFANEHNKPFLVNLAAPFVAQFFKDQLNQVLQHADVIFGNETEALGYGKVMGFGEDIKEIAKQVQAMPRSAESKKKRIVIFTQGPDPAIVCDENGHIHEYQPPKLDKNEIVDSNGAGDAFVGGFLAGYALSKPIEKCVMAGFYSAQTILKVHGTNLKGKSPTFKWD